MAKREVGIDFNEAGRLVLKLEEGEGGAGFSPINKDGGGGRRHGALGPNHGRPEVVECLAEARCHGGRDAEAIMAISRC